jgi:hypothetical protein
MEYNVLAKDRKERLSLSRMAIHLLNGRNSRLRVWTPDANT